MSINPKFSEPGRSINLCTGSTLGGSSMINQMLYPKGLKKEYDMWSLLSGGRSVVDEL
jgi:choline dehydrogenase-like flavoprotein